MLEIQDGLEQKENRVLVDLDFPILACHAAIELDNLIVGREDQLIAVQELAPRIISSQSAPDKVGLELLFERNMNPTDAVTLNCAIRDSKLVSTELQTVEELVAEVERIRETLEQIVNDPSTMKCNHLDTVKKMRAFCVALSKYAAAQRHAVYQWKPRHPYRR